MSNAPRKVMVVAVREYQAAVRTKAFVITIVIMPVLMCGGLIAKKFTESHADVSDKKFAIVDYTNHLYEAIAAAADQRNQFAIYETQEDDTRRQTASRFVVQQVEPADREPAQVRLDLSDRVRNKELFGFLEIDAEALEADLTKPETTLVTYHSNNPVYDDFSDWVIGPIDKAIQAERFRKENLPEETVAWATQRIGRLKDRGLFSAGTSQGDRGDSDRAEARIIVGVVMVMLLFMVIAIGATPLINVVLEEKSQKITEVLLGSIRPFELMLGKLIGSVGVALTVVFVYLGGGYGVMIKLGYADYLPPTTLLIWFLAFQSMAILLFGSMFIAIGAACSDLKEAQSALLPIWLIICIPMFALQLVIREPSSPFVTALSLFPVATPMVMPLRLAIDPTLALWQPFLGLLLALLTTLLCVFAGGRIFRIGILAQGKAPKLSQLLRWAIKG
ncbi:MAG TPA: ABC transporter permease [Phycisphaerae bacterium]|nr:ABC transporter permease [Phycisphaerae bacterium]